MENVIIVLVLLVIVAGIVWYLCRAKKRGEKIGEVHKNASRFLVRYV